MLFFCKGIFSKSMSFESKHMFLRTKTRSFGA